MRDFKETKARVIEAVATARDEALMKVGKAAASRQGMRAAKVRRQKVAKVAVAAVVASSAIAAGALAVRALGKGL